MNTEIVQAAEKSGSSTPAGLGAPAERLSARAKLLAAAGELFYEEGVQSVGIEKVIERAGVAKATLYGNFKGKDDLVRAYLAERQSVRQANILARQARVSEPRDKLLAVFDALADTLAQPGYRGCAFVRASAEMRPESAGRAVCDSARQWTRTLFTDLARAAGAGEPELLAHQLVLLYDGASVSAQMDGDRAGAKAARAVAAQMVEAACGKQAK
jgi:AcrR family transcriptional regulator